MKKCDIDSKMNYGCSESAEEELNMLLSMGAKAEDVMEKWDREKHLSSVDSLIRRPMQGRRENAGHWPMKHHPRCILMFSLFSALNWLRCTLKVCTVWRSTMVAVVRLLIRGLSENKGNRQTTLTELLTGTAKSENKGNRQTTLTELWMETAKSD